MNPYPEDETQTNSPGCAPASEASVPAVPGHYVIERQLGRGGMGAVWLALDTRLGRRVALKFPRAEHAGAEQIERFTREARAASALNHPNIITIYEVGECLGQRFIAMEYIDGITLSHKSAGGLLPLPGVVELGRQILAALEAAHQAGIVHRDLKPDNIMIRPDGLVKVLDFGIAHMEGRVELSVAPGAAPTGGESETVTLALVGTPHYMSPEQALAQPVDARSDIFSLGVILYELIAGERPFSAATPEGLHLERLERKPPPLSPPAVDVVLQQALAKRPENRYTSAREFSAALQSLVATPVGQRAWGWKYLGIAAAALVALAGIAYRYFPAARRASIGPPPEAVAFTTFPGTKAYSSFSPDGRQIAFSWVGDPPQPNGVRSIYIKAIGADEPMRLTEPSGVDEILPAWSPDGKQIAFWRGRDIYIAPAARGGAARKIREAGKGVSWSAEGKSLAIVSVPPPDQGSSIQVLDLSSGVVRTLTNPKFPQFDHDPEFSPDGRWISFLRYFSSGVVEVFVVPAGGGEVRQVTRDRRLVDGHTWTADSREIVFASLRAGGRALWRIIADGSSVPQRIETSGRSPSLPAISRHGNRLAFTDSWTDINLYLYKSGGFTHQPAAFSAPRSVVASTRDEHTPRISPDGRKLAFISNRSGAEEIWVSSIDGSAASQLTRLQAPSLGSVAWSPDGQWLAFDSTLGSSNDVYLMTAGGGKPIRFTPDDEFNEAIPSFSRDGKFLYFFSDRTGQRQIYRQAINGGRPQGAPVQITTGGGMEGYETPDGRYFVFTRNRGVYGLWAVPVGGGKEFLYHSKAGYWRSWGISKAGLYYITKEDAPRQILRFRPFPGEREYALFTVPKEPVWTFPGLSMSDDGQSVVFAQQDLVVNDIMLIENFR
jgi:eukaryotic-like serine/threonine-protein kinase